MRLAMKPLVKRLLLLGDFEAMLENEKDAAEESLEMSRPLYIP
jgi:hypothetical protein